MDMSPSEINVRIEHLLVNGVTEGDGTQVAAAVQRELTRLIAQGSIPASLIRRGHVPALDAGTLGVAPTEGPHTLGERVAQAVYRGLHQ